MAVAKLKVGCKVKVAASPKVTGVVTQANEQGNGWVYEVRLDSNAKALPTYLESQLAAAGARS